MTASASRRLGRTPLVLLAVGALIAGCGVGPSIRPDVAVEQSSDGGRAVPSSDAPPVPSEQAPEAPITDLAWQDCTQDLTSRYGVTATAGVVVECANFSAPIDATDSSAGSFALAAFRVRLQSTPTGAAPVVYTSGTDRPSAADIAVFASQPDTTLIAAHPIVGVDRRGVGSSAPFDCGSAMDSVRQQLFDLGQFDTATADAADRAAAVGRDATIACTDFLQPQALAFGTSASANDLDTLRTTWGVSTLAIIGSGNGSSVALAYAAAHPDNVSRLILDSPVSVNTDAISTAEQAVKGREAAFSAFADRCVASNCSLGADPRATVMDLLDRARNGGLAPISSSALLAAITHSLSFGSPADAAVRTSQLSDALSNALGGDTASLRQALNSTVQITASDGQYVSRCTDGQQWPGPERVRDLAGSWGQQYPMFGTDAAIRLSVCAGWPASPPADLPSEVTVPVLLLSGAADAVVGNDGLAAVRGAVVAAGATAATVTWQGIGHPVAPLSNCARGTVLAYIDDATRGGDGNACPA